MDLRKRFLLLAVCTFFLASVFSGPAYAAEVDILVNKLVEKGLLTRDEAGQLLSEMQGETERQKAEIQQVAQEAAKEETKGKLVELPKWVEKINFKGDLRLRYQSEDMDNDNSPSRDRWRFRWRVGLEAEVNEQWTAGFGLASGSDDPRSTNQTFEDTFQTPDARIDYAFVKYAPAEWVDLLGGKFKNPLWGAKDLLWDGDINPDGFAASLKHSMQDGRVKLFFVPAWFILDEYKADTSDPWMLALQAGAQYSFTEAAYVKVAPSFYKFDALKGNNFVHSAKSNSVDKNGKLIYDYDAWTVDGELGFHFGGPVQMAALFGQYVQSDADKDDTGYLFGAKMGAKKVKAFADWQLKYNYRKLERDAWPDFLPDSDFYGGATNAEGHEVEFVFGLAKNVTIGLDYYFDVEPIDAVDPVKKQDLLQVDLIVKW